MRLLGFSFPIRFESFLNKINDVSSYEIPNTSITLYSFNYIEERNLTYEIQEYEPDFIMIGQDGDMGYFLKNDGNEFIYSNDLGAIGSSEMEIVSINIDDFIENQELCSDD